MSNAYDHAQTLWNYLCLNNDPQSADALLILGCRRLEVAQHGAMLWQQGHGKRVVCSGLGHIANPSFDRPEAHIFAEVCQQMGVPSTCILVEDQSTNTIENIRNTRQLLTTRGLAVVSIGLVTLAYHERRALTTAVHLWPKVHFWVHSPERDMGKYLTLAGERQVFSRLVGSLDRLIQYGKNDLIQDQAIPVEIRESYLALIGLGYIERLLEPGKVEELKRSRI
ncbi:MAG: YdcF family protein [Parcubacteria group bacterium]